MLKKDIKKLKNKVIDVELVDIIAESRDVESVDCLGLKGNNLEWIVNLTNETTVRLYTRGE